MNNWKYVLWVMITLSSCASTKKVVYLQNVESFQKEKITQSYEMKIQSDDLLGITINSRNPELVIPFTLPATVYQSAKSDPASLNGMQQMQGLLVDVDGNINFPVLGLIPVAGMTRLELINLIQNKLIEGEYINDPIVTVKFLNFKVSVLGEVAKPGTFSITSDRISLFDALSMAGDLTIYGKRSNITVIRENNREREIMHLDLRSADVFQSPGYYLQQNDVIYVEPNRIKAGQSGINQNNSVGVWLSVASLLTTLSVLIFK